MHASSLNKMKAFASEYLGPYQHCPLEVLDFGSQEVAGQPNSSYRHLFASPSWRYRGLDMVAGSNVDIVVTEPFAWQEVESDSIDLVISGQTFEHIDFFWISAFEIGRVLKPGGVAAIIAPSAGGEHRFPLDCWRFYPDGFASIARYIGFGVLDVCTDWGNGTWADSMLLMQKPQWDAERRRMFFLALEHQRAVLSPNSFDEPVVETVLPDPSVLSALGEQGGRLDQIFASLRSADAPAGRTSPLLMRTKRAAHERLGPKGVRLIKLLLRRAEAH